MLFQAFLEQQVFGKYVNPNKFNAKELDSETGLYYYGARYYNPRLSIWYGVDPLAVYQPVMETQFYGDGQHNGGVSYLGNLNPYIYTYQNPVRYIDPNGKQTESYATKVHDDNDISQVVKIRGGRYYQNTTDTWAAFKNAVNSRFGGDDDYWVEKKPYNGADNSFIHEAVDTSAGTLIGGGIGKIAGPLLSNIASKISNRFIPNAGKLLNSMLSPTKNGMSKIGQALQKHAGRPGTFQNILYSGKTATEDAMKIVNEIVTSKPMIDLETNGTKSFYNRTTGRGFNVSRNGEFNGFRELPRRDINKVEKVLKK